MANDEQLQAITKSKLLLAEGSDDFRFFKALIDYLERQDIEIRTYGGKDNLRPFLKALPAIPGFANVKSLGITRDADSDADRTFQSIHDSLLDADLPAPNASFVSVPGPPQVAVMIMPPGADRGMLEDLCLSAVQDDPAMPCVDQYFECVEKEMGRLPRNMAKARIHAFLASRERPDRRLGEAALGGELPWDSPSFAPVKQFLNRL